MGVKFLILNLNVNMLRRFLIKIYGFIGETNFIFTFYSYDKKPDNFNNKYFPCIFELICIVMSYSVYVIIFFLLFKHYFLKNFFDIFPNF